MKKILLISSLLISISAFASTDLDVAKQKVNCGSYQLTSKSTAEDVIKNCKVTDENTHKYRKDKELYFEATTTVKIKCEFDEDSNIKKCKIKD